MSLCLLESVLDFINKSIFESSGIVGVRVMYCKPIHRDTYCNPN